MTLPRDPEEVTAAGAPASAVLPPDTRMGAVHLTVADLDRSLGYYGSALGLRVHARDGARAALGTGGEDLLVLTEHPGARPAHGCTGLYHFALLVPQRRDLAAWLAHAARERVPLTGLADHFVSEAAYLTDPDGHGVEIYWDRPRELWEGDVAQRMTTLALDTDSLLRELGDDAGFDGLAGGTAMGHVHLRVREIPSTLAFYRDRLGFALMAAFGPQAVFLSAGGYHHHVGANTWESAGAPPAPPDAARLTQVTILVPEGREERLTDPSGIPVVLTAAP
jgi:catechol 2,3-dioxygenase